MELGRDALQRQVPLLRKLGQHRVLLLGVQVAVQLLQLEPVARGACRAGSRTVQRGVDPVLDDEDAPVEGWKSYEFELAGRPDRVLVLPLDKTNETGIITYVKEEEGELGTRYIHTLNTPSGFRRKLAAVGIYVDSESIDLSPGES